MSAAVPQSQTATFNVTAAGTVPLRYQWRFNNASISGATNSVLSIPTVQPTNAGSYSVVVTNRLGAITSQVAVLSVVIPPAITAEPQSQVVEFGSNATFTVSATGTAPLSFQWLFNGNPHFDGVGSSLTITSVQPSNAGNYAVVVTNLAGSVTSMTATLTVPQRFVRIFSTSSTVGSTMNLPIHLVAYGNENALGCSLGFDPSILIYSGASVGSGAGGASLNLNTNQLASGRLGFTLSLGAGVSFSAGTQEVALVSFVVAADAGDISTPVTLGNQPVFREVSDAQAQPLASTFIDGLITIGAGGGYEADVTPLPRGNNAVTATDWVKVGRYVAGLDTPTNATQFQRADCAPRATLGDSLLTVSDWVQAGRYAAALDSLMLAGGSSSGGGEGGAAMQEPWQAFARAASAPAGRIVRVVDNNIQPGDTNIVLVQLVSQGNESALTFSLSFNASVLSFAAAAPGSGVSGGTVNVNTNQLGAGRLGLAVTLPIGSSFPAGMQELVRLSYVISMTATGSTTVGFADQPVFREVSDAFANALPSTFVSGVLTIGPKLLRLRPPRRQPDGLFQLLIGNADGSAVEPQRVTKVEVLTTTNVALPVTNWFRLTNVLNWSNGVLRLDDSGSNGPPLRFYQAVERP